MFDYRMLVHIIIVSLSVTAFV